MNGYLDIFGFFFHYFPLIYNHFMPKCTECTGVHSVLLNQFSKEKLVKFAINLSP